MSELESSVGTCKHSMNLTNQTNGRNWDFAWWVASICSALPNLFTNLADSSFAIPRTASTNVGDLMLMLSKETTSTTIINNVCNANHNAKQYKQT